MFLTLHTSRLILRPPSIADAPALQAYFNDWEIIRWLRPPVPWPYPENGAQQYLEAIIPEQGESRRTFIITFQKSDIAIGTVDIRLKKDDKGNYAERGFALSQLYWGKGLMHEATAAVTEFIFKDTACYNIVTFNARSNIRSHNIQQKQNFELLRVRESAVASYNGCRDQEEWELTRKAWVEKAAKSDLLL
jgi:[ribosomal protein S5]-alanine N-acetyltransferase